MCWKINCLLSGWKETLTTVRLLWSPLWLIPLPVSYHCTSSHYCNWKKLYKILACFLQLRKEMKNLLHLSSVLACFIYSVGLTFFISGRKRVADLQHVLFSARESRVESTQRRLQPSRCRLVKRSTERSSKMADCSIRMSLLFVRLPLLCTFQTHCLCLALCSVSCFWQDSQYRLNRSKGTVRTRVAIIIQATPASQSVQRKP